MPITLTPDLIALLAGSAVTGLALLLLTHWLRQPPRRQTRLPPGLPPWWRLLWPWAQTWGERRAGRRTALQRQRLAQALQRAGLSRVVPVEQMLGLQALGATSGGIGAVLLTVGLALDGGVGSAWLAGLVGGSLGAWLPHAALRQHAQARREAIVRALPFVLDMTTLCVEGGLHLQQALQQAVRKGPSGPLQGELEQVLSDIRAGQSRAEALRGLAKRVDAPAIQTWVLALTQAESLGMSLSPILRAQAEQRRTERFLAAEKQAMQAPVKMLLPLIACIFPCTFLVLGFPMAQLLLQGLEMG